MLVLKRVLGPREADGARGRPPETPNSSMLFFDGRGGSGEDEDGEGGSSSSGPVTRRKRERARVLRYSGSALRTVILAAAEAGNALGTWRGVLGVAGRGYVGAGGAGVEVETEFELELAASEAMRSSTLNRDAALVERALYLRTGTETEDSSKSAAALTAKDCLLTEALSFSRSRSLSLLDCIRLRLRLCMIGLLLDRGVSEHDS